MKALIAALLLPTAAHANRAVMEMIAASNNTVYVDTVNARVGVSTATPATTLDVAGTSQFGTTAKSTFSTTGALTMASGAALTLSGAAGNVVSAASVTASGFFGAGTGITGIASTVTLTGTANRVVISGNAPAFTLSGPQDLGSVSSPTFANATLTYGLTAATAALSGNSFTVGAATFVVSASSVGIDRAPTGAAALEVAGSVQIGSGTAISTFTAGGLLQLTSSGIKWFDGSISTTAGSSGANVASLTSTNSWSTTQTFTSSVTVGLTGYTSTSTISALATVNTPGRVTNTWQIVASTNPSGASQSCFYGFDTYRDYFFRFILTNTTLGQYTVQFNSDGGANYRVSGSVCDSSAGCANTLTGDSNTSINVAGSPNNVQTGRGLNISFFVNNEINSTKRVHMQDLRSEYMDSNNHEVSVTGAAVYDGGSTAFTSVCIKTTAGSQVYSGYIYVYGSTPGVGP